MIGYRFKTYRFVIILLHVDSQLGTKNSRVQFVNDGHLEQYEKMNIHQASAPNSHSATEFSKFFMYNKIIIYKLISY